MEFTTEVRQAGKAATGLPVPAEVLEALGAGKRPAVVVTIGGHVYRSTIGTMGRESLIPLSAEHRKAAGVAGGDSVTITVVLDTEERTYDVPDDLAQALAAAGLREVFDGLAPSHRKEHVRAVSEAKKPETRVRRVEKAVELVRAKQK